jgi:hypothetical protein
MREGGGAANESCRKRNGEMGRVRTILSSGVFDL